MNCILNKPVQGVIAGLISAALALLLFHMDSLKWMENVTWDWRVRYHATPSRQTDQVKLVFLDQASLDWGKEVNNWPWPWPRTVYTAVLDFCGRGGAKAVIFDIVFTEHSQYGTDDDAELGKAICRLGNYIQAFEVGRTGSLKKWPESITALTCTRPAWTDKLAMPSATFPINEISSSAAMLGNVSGVMDDDALVRRIAPFMIFDGKFVPSLALAAFLTANPDHALRIAENNLYVKDNVIPLDRHGRTILKFRGPSQTHQTVSMASVIQSELKIQAGETPILDPSFFSNSYVFVGMTATGLRDLKPVPVAREYPGVEVHATFLDNLLANDLVRNAPLWWTVCCTIVMGLTAGIAVRLSSNWKHAVLAVFLTTPLPLLAGFILYTSNVWLPVAPPLLTAILSSLSSLITNYAVEGRQKRFMKNAFKQYLSPAVIERLVSNPGSLKLGGELRELSILFSDIQGFTTISESLNPEQLTSMLNHYLSAMTSIIYEEGGTIDKYEGDAIIAFWNAPLDDPDHARNSVRAALRCQKKLAEMRPELKTSYGVDVYVRFGINTGPVVIGNMGSEQRFNYTFLGDAGNLASRLEGINKQFETGIMISEFTAKQLNDEFDLKEISRVQVKGKEIPVTVFEPYFHGNGRTDERQKFSNALQAYYTGDFEFAGKLFASIAATDTTAAIYQKRCTELKQSKPETWNGVWIMTEK